MRPAEIRRQLCLGDDAFLRLTRVQNEFETVLDIGGADGFHAIRFAGMGKKVTMVDLSPTLPDALGVDILACDYLKAYTREKDLIWCCHTLEHQPNPQLFLAKIRSDLKEGGFLAIIVPPAKQDIVSGHLTLWNAGLVLYHLVLAGFDCRDARILENGYNISVIIRKKSIEVPHLKWDVGDLTSLRAFFPAEIEFENDSFNGDIKRLNW